MNPIKSIFSNLFIPFLILALSVATIFYEAKIPQIFFTIVPYLFYVVSLLVLSISWHFNRTKFIFVVVALVLVELGFKYLGAKDIASLYLYISMIFPLHLLIFLFLKERGIFSFWGMPKVAFFLLEIGGIFYLVRYKDIVFDNIFSFEILTMSFNPLTDISVIIGLVVFFVMSIFILFSRDLIYATSFLVLHITFYVGLYFFEMPNVTELSFLTAVIIVFSILTRELYKLAFYDELTSLPGRRALVEDMAKLGRKYTLAMCDIDFFKKFNDTYGHDVGDEVLKMVASIFGEVDKGKAYRYGGEEFVILFPSKDVDEAFIYADILRQKIASTPFSVRNKKNTTKKIFINISIGIVQNKADDKDPFAVMKRADNALYKAKKAGRNQVIKGI